MSVITLRQNMVSCEGGDTLVVTLDCESPSWVLQQSPGLRQEGCCSLPGVAFGDLRGKSWSYFSCHNRLWKTRRGKSCFTFRTQKVPSEPEYVRRLFLENTRDREVLLIPLSLRCPAERAAGFLCSLHCCQYLPAFLPLYHEVETCHTTTPHVIFWKSGEQEQPEQ